MRADEPTGPPLEGNSVLCLSDRPYRLSFPGGVDAITVKVTRGRLPRWGLRLDALHGQPLREERAGEVAILRDFVLGVLDLPSAATVDRRVLGRIVIALMSLAVTGSPAEIDSGDDGAGIFGQAVAIVERVY